MTRQVQSPQTVGFYGQLYNDIVRPNQIWRSSRYFVRRWGPILEPSRFWAVVAARHLSYLSEEQNGNFKAWDNEIAGEASLSNSHYRRLKHEMGESSSPLSLFLKKGSLSYTSNKEGRVRKGRTRYTVRLDDPLTPADARQVEAVLRDQGLNRSTKPEEIVNILDRCRMLEQTRFYATENELTSTTYGSWQAIYVTDVVQAITQKNLGDYPAVAEQAEALHSYLTSGDFIGRRYFRDSWLPILGTGPAWLLTWLRSHCFLDESTGEIRNELAFSKLELAEKLGIHKNALNRWLKALERTPEQPFSFVKELNRAKQPDNVVLVTFEVGMFEPLTVSDIEVLSDKYEVESASASLNPSGLESDLPKIGPENKSSINTQSITPLLGERVPATQGGEGLKWQQSPPNQNERYKMNGADGSTHTDERYEQTIDPRMGGGAIQNERYVGEPTFQTAHMNERAVTPSVQIERNSDDALSGSAHQIEQNTDFTFAHNHKMNGSHPSNEPAIDSKRDDIYKHLKKLTALLPEDEQLDNDDFELLNAAVADFGQDVGIAQTIFGGRAQFLRAIGADAGASWTVQVLEMGIPLMTLSAWWLYALAEPGIKRPVPFVLKRASGGYQAPEQFVRLAKMGLDDWLTCCLGYELGIEVDVPGRELWEEVYANYSVEAVPFVGELVGSLLDRMRARKEKRDESEEVNSGRWSVSGGSEPTTGHRPSTTGNAVGNAIWVKVLEQLAGQVSKMEMEIFLRPCVLLFGSVSNAAGWVLQAQDGSAEAYIRMVLAGKIEQVLAGLGISGGLQVTSGAVTDNVQRTTENEQLVTDPPNTEYRPTDHWLLDTVSLWDGVLAELQLALPASTYSTWLKDSALVPNGAGGYLVEVRNDQAKDWVQNRFFDLIVQIMAGILGNREFDLGVVSRK